MSRFRKLITAAFVLMLVVLLAGCGSDKMADNTPNRNNEISQNSSLGNTSADIEYARSGNANYNIVNGGWVDEEDGWLYYGLKDGLYKCKEDGSQKEKLVDAAGGIYNINVIGDWVYYRASGIHRIRTDGSGYEQIAAEDVRGGVHFVGDNIYNGSEYRMKFDGSKKERIYNKNSACGYTLNIVDGWIYFYDTDQFDDTDKIYKMSLDGTDIQTIFDGRSDHMVVDGDWIYFSHKKDDNRLYKMKTDGTEMQPLLDSSVSYILVSDGWIYYTSGGIYKVRTDGTENQLLCDEAGHELQLHGEWLYYKENYAAYRVKIDGTEHQLFADVGEVALGAIAEVSNSDIESIGEIVLTRSYETKFGEENAITYPSFIIEYPGNWVVSSTEVTPENETIILTNDRGVEIKYSYIGNVPEGGFGGGSMVTMSRVEVTSVADSQFIPWYVQDTDPSALGKFVVAKLKETGQLNMQTDSDFRDVDGAVSFAVVPETRVGVDDCVRLPYTAEFAFWYSGYISLIANAPDGQFTAQEEAEVTAILSSFRAVD